MRKEEGGHEDGEGGEVERLVDVADMSSTETSDSELGSEVVAGSERSREGAHSWAYCWRIEAMLAGQNAPLLNPAILGCPWEKITVLESQRGSVSQQRWTTTCCTLKRSRSCCRRDRTLQKETYMNDMYICKMQPFKKDISLFTCQVTPVCQTAGEREAG